MSCSNLMPPQANCEKLPDFIDEAGKVVGINLTEPIDLSQMKVLSAECIPEFSDLGTGVFYRKVALFTHTVNEFGEQEELTINFTLKSNRRPKP